MNRIWKATRLQLNKRDISFLVPAAIIGMVLVITAIIAFALQRAGLDAQSADYAANARNNTGMVFALPGFLIYFGVQAVATTFPFGLALGMTRRAYVAGTALAHLITSAYIALIMLVLLWIELATNHWFFGVYALDSYVLGAGNPGVLLATAFLGTLASLSIGSVFGAVWVRYGNRGPLFLGLALILVIAVLVLAFVPQAAAIIAAITGGTMALVGVGISVAALVGTWLATRRASVR